MIRYERKLYHKIAFTVFHGAKHEKALKTGRGINMKQVVKFLESGGMKKIQHIMKEHQPPQPPADL